MYIKNQLNGKRFYHLMLNEFLTANKSILISIGAIVGVLLIVNVSSVGSYGSWSFHEVFFPITFLVAGHIIASMAFQDVHHKQKSYTYLTLPASMPEKYLSKLLTTSVVYTIAGLIVYFLFSLLATGLSSAFFGMSHGIFNPFTRNVWLAVALYIVTHSVTFFGAIYFKRFNLVKTVLAINVFSIALAIIIGIVVRIVFWDYFQGFSFVPVVEIDEVYLTNIGVFERMGEFGTNLLTLAKILLGYIMPIFFWVTGFFKLKETEV
jgi:hypothetical protein